MGGAGGLPGPPGVGDRTEGGRASGMDTSSHSVKKIPLETATGPPSTSKDSDVIADIQLTTEHGLGSGGSTRSAATPAQPVAQLRQQLQAILSGPVGVVDGMLKLVELQDQSGRAPGACDTRLPLATAPLGDLGLAASMCLARAGPASTVADAILAAFYAAEAERREAALSPAAPKPPPEPPPQDSVTDIVPVPAVAAAAAAARRTATAPGAIGGTRAA